ncbi:hypothetical protein TTHERM_000299748 (macronuclear) [Tetrahymena thermophila SB210]|uniref:Uncharacterized protein n=1 Tax=Tetrahymena thermophila (strain SB210) TaxID=312017 RepID=W7X327_TETTS|nr:hypothetical protein TTHERM_000299748 [Tetrahymena thermophila SB210]EWS71852.1 hypothetical protein TTHERM_000299748 [Tetrahymena thermophila SB210]|eukprot:XP_012655596.1 hypothetical protein TTHERM_000299748 [Tetrahymena thermophila SB210]
MKKQLWKRGLKITKYSIRLRISFFRILFQLQKFMIQISNQQNVILVGIATTTITDTILHQEILTFKNKMTLKIIQICMNLVPKILISMSVYSSIQKRTHLLRSYQRQDLYKWILIQNILFRACCIVAQQIFQLKSEKILNVQI